MFIVATKVGALLNREFMNLLYEECFDNRLNKRNSQNITHYSEC